MNNLTKEFAYLCRRVQYRAIAVFTLAIRLENGNTAEFNIRILIRCPTVLENRHYDAHGSRRG